MLYNVAHYAPNKPKLFLQKISSHGIKRLLDFYNALITSEKNLKDLSSISDMVPSLVIESDNMLILRLPTDMDIKQAIFDLDLHNAPKPDIWFSSLGLRIRIQLIDLTIL